MRLPSIFVDHMVLQQEAALPVWGWADPGEIVTVTFGPEKAETVENLATFGEFSNGLIVRLLIEIQARFVSTENIHVECEAIEFDRHRSV